MYPQRSFYIIFYISLYLSICSISPLSGQNGSRVIDLAKLVKEHTFKPNEINQLRSMADGIHFTQSDGLGRYIFKYSYADGLLVDTLLNMNRLQSSVISQFYDYSFSDDESKILLYNNRERIYRRSFKADYYIYDVNSGVISPLAKGQKVQLATFSPDASKVAYVFQNNIYIKELKSGKTDTVTRDGRLNHIINGAPDWVYEEEFGFNQAFEWSPDGACIAFLRFDESAVKEFGMTMFAGTYPRLEENILYPEHRVWKYPKAGEDNSIVGVKIYHLYDQKTVEVDVGENTDQYLPRIRWTPFGGKLCISRLNRLQNKIELLLADRQSGVTHMIYREENQYYIAERILDDIYFMTQKDAFIIGSERNGYYHLYLHDLAGNEKQQITAGEWDVTKFYGYDEKTNNCFYQAASKSPLQREIYATNVLSGKHKELSVGKGWHTAHFSAGFQFYIDNFSSASEPNSISLMENDGRLIRVLEDNQAYSQKIAAFAFNTKEFFSFESSEGVLLNGYMIKPPSFDKNRQYPVLMTQYSGPGSQTVKDSWNMDWLYALAAKGYIIVSVDGRGTGARGEEFRKMTYLQLGKYESLDQIETARYLKTLDYVDPDRIGIYGWSYGGFISSLSILLGGDVFKAAIAVAPVTDYRYYDNIYTERYMRRPQDNPGGYYDYAPLNHAEKLQGSLLLIHGLADDNVHVQNTLEFAEKLVQADKQFEMQLYTNRNHSIYGGNTRYHLYQRMMKFIEEKL